MANSGKQSFMFPTSGRNSGRLDTSLLAWLGGHRGGPRSARSVRLSDWQAGREMEGKRHRCV